MVCGVGDVVIGGGGEDFKCCSSVVGWKDLGDVGIVGDGISVV